MATDRERQRCRERLDRLSASGLDRDSLRMEAIADLRRVIGFERWCWPLADPQTLLPLDALAEHDYGPGVPRALSLEYSGHDVAAKNELARRPSPVTSISAETSGDLAASPRWDEVMRAVGIGDVAVLACRDGLGTWGWLEAYRDRDDRPFAAADLELLRSAARGLGSALRRRVMARSTSPSGGARPPGILLLDPDLRLASATLGARAWLEAMPGAELYHAFGILPAVFYPAAALALSPSSPQGTRSVTRTVDGGWMVIEVAALDGPQSGWTAVGLRTATIGETFDLFCRAFALTSREREIMALLVSGMDTREVSRRSSISAYTVQDHLKSIFEKVGVHSRRELLATLASADDGLSQLAAAAAD